MQLFSPFLISLILVCTTFNSYMIYFKRTPVLDMHLHVGNPRITYPIAKPMYFSLHYKQHFRPWPTSLMLSLL